MHRTRVKICGIRDLDTALAAAEAGVDAVGFVFVPSSPRVVTPAQARSIVAGLPAFVEPVGLFVNQPADQVRRIATDVGLRTVQLHGSESPEEVAALAPLRVIKAVTFESRIVSVTLARWRPRPENLAGLLFDTPPLGQMLPGGTGRQFDWDALAALKHGGMLADLPPLILAGGLSPENVAHAIATLAPYAVDVSSGVEASKGVKDPRLMRAFVQAVQLADAAPKA